MRIFKDLVKIVPNEAEANKYIEANQKNYEKELKTIKQRHPNGTEFIVIYIESNQFY